MAKRKIGKAEKKLREALALADSINVARKRDVDAKVAHIEFLTSQLQKREKDLDQVLAAAKLEKEVHRSTITMLLDRYDVRDPRVHSWTYGDGERIDVKASFAMSGDAVAMPVEKESR